MADRDPHAGRREFDADPPHPDGFPGSDEESHLMSTRQGLRDLDEGASRAQTQRVMEEAGITREEAEALLRRIRDRYSALARTMGGLNAELSHLGIHALKTWTEYFEAVADGRKTFEIRKNDRDYHVGDTLILRDWNRDEGTYTGRRVEVEVTYMTDAASLGCLEEGYVCMGIRRVS